MGLRVNTNVNAQNALRNLRASDRMQQGSLERLSSGLRINRASDDPSGLVISEKLRAQISSLNQALSNTQNDINLINTAEASLSEIGDILADMRGSAIFALNTGFASAEQIRAEQDKVNQSLVAIDRIARSTRFASRGLLNGESDFQVNRLNGGAFDDLTVRSIRMAPGASEAKVQVNVSRLAERATLVTNLAADSGAGITDGSGSGFATLRVSGSKGSADLQMASGSTAQDLVNAINQNTSATGVFAGTYRPMGIDSGSAEMVVKGAGAGIQLNGNGQDMVFSVQVGSSAAQTVVINSGAGDSVISEAELDAALKAVDSNFEVYTKDGDLYIRNAAGNFTISGAQNARTFTLRADQIATMFNAGEDGAAAAFGENTAIAFDVDGDGVITAGDEEFTFANTGGSGVDTPADMEALLAALRGMAAFGGNAAVHTDADGNVIIVDTTGNTLGSANMANVGIQNTALNDDVLAPALNGAQLVANYGGDLGKLRITGDAATARDEAVSFINFKVPAGFVSESGELAIAVTAVSGGTLNFEIRDANNATPVAVSVADADGDGFITLADIQTALDGVSDDAVDNDDARTSYQAYFDKNGGLTIVDRFGGNFTVAEDSAGTDTDLRAVFGRSGGSAVSNFERIALYSTEFGSHHSISLEDVTQATSGVQLKAAHLGGLAVTGNGRTGLGAVGGASADIRGLKGTRIEAVGKDVSGSIAGVSFTGRGFDVDFVTDALDVKFRLGEHWGVSGTAGSRADAAAYGFAANAGLSGAYQRHGMYSGMELANGYLDRVEFTVRHGTGSGMRFQIREGNGAADSILLGIGQISTGTLGARLTPEQMQGAGFDARFPGGALNTLRTGAGNDLSGNPANALEIIDRAIDQVAGLRSYLGSVSADTLQRNLNSVSVAVENLSGAQSFIRDLDFAQETTAFTKAQILFQAGTSVLSAANSIPQAVLSLLRGI